MSKQKVESRRQFIEIEGLVLKAFHRAARHVPAYREMLDARGVVPQKVRTLADFMSVVPLTDKNSTFVARPLPALCVGGSIAGATAAYTSSGFTPNAFSFGLETPQEAKVLRGRVDDMLAMHFGAGERPTLVINALPMGVRVPTDVATVIETGLRADAVLAAVTKIGPHIGSGRRKGQIVIIAEHPFLKKVLEAGVDEGIDWSRFVVHAVTGAEVMPESFRRYAGDILGHQTTGGTIAVSLGISEVGLSVGQETPVCRHLRGLAADDPRVRRALFGDTPFLPTFVQWDPRHHLLETPPSPDGKPRLVVTTLSTTRKIPLIRYATGDWARVATPEEITAAVRSAGIRLPRIKPYAPFIMVWGRGRSVHVGMRDVYPEEVKEVVYRKPGPMSADGPIAGAVTGYFHVATLGDRLTVTFRLKRDRTITKPDAARVGDFLTRQLGMPTTAAFEDFYHPDEQIELSYQRKFRYL